MLLIKFIRSRTNRAVIIAASLLLSISALSAQTTPSLVINEIDYDQPSTDTAEFVEIKNVSTAPVDLDPYSLVFINGAVANSAPYVTVNLPAVTLAAGDYYVVCANPATVTNCDLDGAPDTNYIQNGNPDAVGLRQDTTLIDTVSYGGNTFAPYTEGLGANTDSAALTSSGISRFPDGTDTNQNNLDFSPRCITPGAANTSQTSGCGSTAVTVRIRDIQGASQTPPLLNQSVTGVPGIVTGLKSNGFFMQDPLPDANDATSEGIFVFTNSAPTVTVGASVTVNGFVNQFFNLTQITSPVITVVSSGNALPAPIVIGTGGRVPPNTVIDDDGNTTFDATADGLDFYESLEGMRVQVNNAIVVGPTNNFGEIVVVGDSGSNGGGFTPRGGIYITPTDFNPERIFLDDGINPTPVVNVGDRFAEPIIGVLDYTFDNYKLQVTSTLALTPGGLTQEVAAPANAGELSVASLNVENLSAVSPAEKFGEIANLVVTNLQSPDILALEEIQDNTGATNDGVVDASATLNALISAISAAGGPSYTYREIAPVNNSDGGEPGGNIRVAFLFRADRVTFVDRPGATSTTPVGVVAGAAGPELTFSPGRIDPTNPAFNSSRKPLVGEFIYNGRTVFVIANHFNSKGGDQPLFGLSQPPQRSSEVQRWQQAQIVNNFVDSVLALDANAKIIVLGDLNDFQFSETLNIVAGGVLTNLVNTLPVNEQYTYVFDGNTQVLDNLLVSGGLLPYVTSFDILHVNAEFAASIRASDHDSLLARFSYQPPNVAPVAFNDEAVTNEDTPVDIALTANDIDPDSADPLVNISIVTFPASGTVSILGGGTVTYTPNPNFNGIDTFIYQVCDGGNLCALATVTVTVTPVNDLPQLAVTLTTVTVNEGTTATNNGIVMDVDGDSVTVTASVGVVNGSSIWDWSFATTDGPAQSQTVTITATDAQNGVTTATFDLIVNNVPPTVNAGADVTVYRNDIVSFAGSFTDPGTGDTHTLVWDFGDGSGAADTLTPTHSYPTEGQYTVTLNVTDKDLGFGSDTLLVTVLNRAPECSLAAPSVTSLWPADHSFIPVSVLNVTDPEGDLVTITITGVWQDEPVNGAGDGAASPDAVGVGSSTVSLRAERAGNGNGRYYHVNFTAMDGHGGSCTGVLLVSVPQNQGSNGAAVNDGALFDSSLP